MRAVPRRRALARPCFEHLTDTKGDAGDTITGAIAATNSTTTFITTAAAAGGKEELAPKTLTP